MAGMRPLILIVALLIAGGEAMARLTHESLAVALGFSFLRKWPLALQLRKYQGKSA